MGGSDGSWGTGAERAWERWLWWGLSVATPAGLRRLLAWAGWLGSFRSGWHKLTVILDSTPKTRFLLCHTWPEVSFCLGISCLVVSSQEPESFKIWTLKKRLLWAYMSIETSFLLQVSLMWFLKLWNRKKPHMTHPFAILEFLHFCFFIGPKTCWVKRLLGKF